MRDDNLYYIDHNSHVWIKRIYFIAIEKKILFANSTDDFSRGSTRNGLRNVLKASDALHCFSGAKTFGAIHGFGEPLLADGLQKVIDGSAFQRLDREFIVCT